MDILSLLAEHDYEQVMAFQNRASGLRGFLAIHDTTLGPALGGIRIWRYASEADALRDVLRLARGMTYKAALAELPAGGGKIVVLDHPELERPQAFEDLGRLVESFRGRFYTGRDVGITDADLEAMARTTGYVACESSPELGDISEHTAIGVLHAMRACAEFAGVARPRVAIQGLGSVGMWLARLLAADGSELVVADIDAARAREAEKQFGARVVPPEEILAAECDVLAPCALGAVINRQTIPRLRARIVCGSANNILATPEDGDELARRGILYAPDYLANAGGLIRGAEFDLLKVKDSRPSLEKIYGRMRRVIELAVERKVSTARVADELAEARLKRGKTYADLHWGGAVAAPRGACSG